MASMYFFANWPFSFHELYNATPRLRGFGVGGLCLIDPWLVLATEHEVSRLDILRFDLYLMEGTG